MWKLCLLLVLTACAAKCASLPNGLALRHQGNAAKPVWNEESILKWVSVNKVGLRRQALRRLQQNADLATRSCDTACQKDQRDALSKLFTAWGGLGWTQRDNWLSNSTVCRWYGVLCCLIQPVGPLDAHHNTEQNDCPPEATGVLGLSLPSNNITGDIADVSWAAFSSTLLLLDLDDNQLSGDTTAWARGGTGGAGGLAALISLQYLSAGGNRLQGTLEPFLALRNLSALIFHGNMLSGTLPKGLMIHPSLEFLDLDENQLSGPLPNATFTSSNRLRSISLSHNSLSGAFPEQPEKSAAAAQSLTHLDISNNRIEGTLPPYLAWLLLDYLDVSSNRLSGPVAPLLQTSWAMLMLDLSNNSLNGTLPSDVRCRHIHSLDLSRNNLTGTIPASFAKLHSVMNLLLNDNPRLSGQLPDTLPTLSQLSYFDIRNTSMQATKSGQEGLPQLITLSESTLIITSDPGSPTCPMPLLRGSTPVGIAPFYWQFVGCKCKEGFTRNETRGLQPGAANGSSSSSVDAIIGLSCFPVSARGPVMPGWGIALVVLGSLLTLALLALLAYRLVPSVVRYRTMLAKRMPPGFSRRAGGCVVTLVLTDVEGSTELWEWDTDLMAAAIDLHDHTLRSQMSKWYGYEVQTEGDAFLMAFHEPADAAGWCITTQLALLNADWNRELFRHHKACIETLVSLQPNSQSHSCRISQTGVGAAAENAPHVTEAGMLMARPFLPPGVVLGPGPQPNSAVAGPSGRSSARGGLTPQRTSAGGNDDASAAAAGSCAGGVGGGGASGGYVGRDGATAGSGPGGGCLQDNNRQPNLASEVKNHDATLGGMASAAEFADWTRYTRLGVLYRGLRVRMGVATGVTDAITSHAITQRMEYSGEVYRRVQAVADLPQGGQILLDANTFNAIHNNLNDLGIRAVQILTRDKRSSKNGTRAVFGGVRAADRRRVPRSLRTRQSLDLAFAPEAIEPPGLAGGAAADGDEEVCHGGTTAATAFSIVTSIRTMSVGGGWMRGGVGSTPINSLRSVLGSGIGYMSSTFARGSSPLLRQPGGPEPSGRSFRTGFMSFGRNSSNHPNHLGHSANYSNPYLNNGNNNLKVTGNKLQLPGLQAAAEAAAEAASGDARSGPLPQSAAVEHCSIGGGSGYGLNGGRGPMVNRSASGGSAGGGRALAGLVAGGGGSNSGGLPVPLLSPRQRAPSATGMYGGLSSHLERVSQESSCKDRDLAPDTDLQLVDGPSRDGQEAASGSGGRQRQASLVGRRRSGGGGGGGLATGLLVGDGPVSTSDMDSVQYGGSPRDLRVGHLRDVPTGPVSQAAPATRATAALNTLAREVIQRRSSIAPAISVVNMGVYELNAGGSLEYVNITQVLVPGLEERARLGKPLDSARQLTPGYFNAPATSVAPLGSGLWAGVRQRGAFPLVTLVFCSMERFTEMVAVNRDLSMNVMAAYNDCVRRSLLALNGYECQEQEGNYMIAFAKPAEALEWCLMLQELMMEVAWTPSMLRLPAMQEELHPLTGTILFRGPRIKAGVYQGMPTRVSPHSTTGRADYFGPLVNRAARYCHAAAQGGQVIASRCLVEEILRDLLHGELLPAEELPAEELPVRQVAVVDNSAVVLPRWCMPQDVMGSGLGGGGGGTTTAATPGSASAGNGGGDATGSGQRSCTFSKLIVPLVDASSAG
ncbi:hypothetical protein Vretimale_13299, partial [Volvox reticuliferus]